MKSTVNVDDERSKNDERKKKNIICRSFFFFFDDASFGLAGPILKLDWNWTKKQN